MCWLVSGASEDKTSSRVTHPSWSRTLAGCPASNAPHPSAPTQRRRSHASAERARTRKRDQARPYSHSIPPPHSSPHRPSATCPSPVHHTPHPSPPPQTPCSPDPETPLSASSAAREGLPVRVPGRAGATSRGGRTRRQSGRRRCGTRRTWKEISAKAI